MWPWPTTARSVGQAERFWRWCSRNPAVAGLAASVAFALVLGAVISGFFAGRSDAADPGGGCRAWRTAAIDRNGEGVRPVFPCAAAPTPDGDADNHETLSEPEVAALWDLSLQEGLPIRLRFLDEATRDPFTARQLRLRPELPRGSRRGP